MPKKELPKSYLPSEYEGKIYDKWEKSGFFNPDKCISEGITAKDAKSYSIVMPPPNVTGTLHMGHAVMLVIEDILTRYHRMKGEKVLWLPGTDHAAIATQTKVEKIIKEEGTDRHKLGREEFLKRVNKFAQESHDTIVRQVRKMGSSCDWSREAFTLDETRNKAVRSVFKLMYDDGLIYRGDRVVNWCPRCHSTLADDEVEYKKQQAQLYTFKYDKDFPFSIATTRPETKLGDTAVAVNPNDKRFKKYIGKTFKVNFVGVPLEIKVIGDRSVDMEFGTGALGVTPAHSMADWQMAQENDLKVIKVINEDGKINEGFGEFSGKSVEQARQMVIARLDQNGLIEKEEEIENNLSVCYRCGTPIEPLPSLQWFIDVNKKIPKYKKSIKELSLEAVKSGVFGRKKINIIPDRFNKTYFHWMENLRDWCISRQLWYGHRIPVWYKENEVYVGVEAPDDSGWMQDSDTLDTWFSSGLWTFTTLANKPEQISIENGKLKINSDDFMVYHPTAVLETGYDILFFWVARMIIMTVYSISDIPFQDVYLHGLVRDDKGRKMSKSLGNSIDPLDSCKMYGTDATRLSLVVGSTPGNDMNLSQEKISGLRNLINKLWNIARFILGSEGEIEAIDENKLTLADNWILYKLDELIKEISADLDDYNFSAAGEKLREFTWNDLADWYLEASKFENKEQKPAILNLILVDLLKLWHPFIPFVTEAIWQEMGKEKFIMVEKWPQPLDIKIDKKLYKNFELTKQIITAIRNARAQYKINPSQKIKAVIYGGKDFALIQTDLVKSLRTGVEEIQIEKSGKKVDDAIYLAIGETEVYLLVPGFDFGAEAKRLNKEIIEQEKRVDALKKKLKNKEFVAKAPVQIVDKEKEKLNLWQIELDKLKEQLKHLR